MAVRVSGKASVTEGRLRIVGFPGEYPPIQSGLVIHLDAAKSSSYDGSSQLWKNLESLPADGANQTDYDIRLGQTLSVDSDDPIFHGAAGAGTSEEYWTYGGLTQITNDKDLHQLIGLPTNLLKKMPSTIHPTGYTIEVWVWRPDTGVSASTYPAFSVGRIRGSGGFTNAVGMSVNLVTSGTQQLRVLGSNNQSSTGSTSNTIVNTLDHGAQETWHQYVFTRNTSTSPKNKLYVDSVLKDTSDLNFVGNAGDSLISDDRWNLGVLRITTGTGTGFAGAGNSGRTAIVRVYNRVLSSEEVEFNFGANKNRFGI